MRRVPWFLAGGAALLLAGCGQKGALYLPDKNAQVVTTAAAPPGPAQWAPVPPTTPRHSSQPTRTAQLTKARNLSRRGSDLGRRHGANAERAGQAFRCAPGPVAVWPRRCQETQFARARAAAPADAPAAPP